MNPWLTEPLPEAAWRAPREWTWEMRHREQALAARGVDRRVGSEGQLARVQLKKLPRRRRIYAYLRWRSDGRHRSAYLGEVNRDTRVENLRLAWERALERGLVTLEVGEELES